MFKKAVLAVVAGLPLLLAAQTVSAAGPGGFARSYRSPAFQFIAASRPTLAPYAFVKFCNSNPADCFRPEGEAMVELTADRRSELQRVNSSVNRAIVPVNDNAGGDVWQADVNSGDCEDFALTKRRELIARGWSARALRLAVAHTQEGEGHAVLVVKTSNGDLVLDNRTSMIRNWRRTDLRWVKIQSGENPRLWFSL